MVYFLNYVLFNPLKVFIDDIAIPFKVFINANANPFIVLILETTGGGGCGLARVLLIRGLLDCLNDIVVYLANPGLNCPGLIGCLNVALLQNNQPEPPVATD